MNTETQPKIIKNFRWVLIRRRRVQPGYNPAEVLHDFIKAHDAGTEFPNPTEDHKKLPLGFDGAGCKIKALTLRKFSTISLRPMMPVVNSETQPKITKNFRWVLIRRR
jgi:hypothetical protein